MNNMSKASKVIGIDIGGTKCAVILGCIHSAVGREEGKASEQIENPEDNNTNYSIEIIDRFSFPTEAAKGFEYTISNIEDSIYKILSKNGRDIEDISAIGISCGGPLDSKRGIIMSPPNLIGWDNIHIVERLERRFGIKTRLQNDANACALAEWRFGAARGCSNVVFLTFGTGMGAGLILDGRLYSGTSDMAGEVGHIRLAEHGPVGFGKSGSFEGFCSGGGIAQLARIKVLEKLQAGQRVSFCENPNMLEKLTAKIVGDAAEEGDELAIEIYNICGRYLGKGLSVIIDILNPEIVVIGSIFARSRNLLWLSAKEEIESESLHYSRNVCRVVPADLGEKIGDYAALAVALQ